MKRAFKFSELDPAPEDEYGNQDLNDDVPPMVAAAFPFPHGAPLAHWAFAILRALLHFFVFVHICRLGK